MSVKKVMTQQVIHIHQCALWQLHRAIVMCKLQGEEHHSGQFQGEEVQEGDNQGT